ncbi:mitochondrial fission factor homolog B isoform X3 [Astyanax mexicanus]|uniref:mitochondrial fission factor homolog B isoform X3 n=1 Tax=Astyanax mexicanus TaxID=7994 RepID=UPI0020CB0C77|nr:mitochondrial fission factor homolog B isoform X3 [Astyanax mexicanus]
MATYLSGGGRPLTLRHGVRCKSSPALSVEAVLLGIGEQIGYKNIMCASRLNKAVIVFLKEAALAHRLIEEGLRLLERIPSSPGPEIWTLSSPLHWRPCLFRPLHVFSPSVTGPLTFSKLKNPVFLQMNRYTLSTLDTTIEGGADDMAVGDATSLRRQIIKLNRRLQLLEEENKERAKREMIMYSVTVAFWLINSWVWLRR